MGTIAYSPLKIQVEKMITNPQTEKDSSENGTEAEKVVNKTKGSEDGAEAETSITEKTSNDEIAQKDQTVKEDEKNKTEEKDQKQEGIEDEPPVNTTFKILDFSKFYKSVLLLPTQTSTPTPFVNSNIGRIKTTPKPTPVPIPSNKAIVITLDTVKIHDKEDPFSNGEVQIATSIRAGSVEQVNAWPYKNWGEANNGDTLKVRQPIFIYPKDSIDEKLAIWISVVENDSLPKSAPGLIKKATDISSGSNSVYQDPTVISKENLYNQTIDKYTKWLGAEQHIGTLATVLYKSQNFGMGNDHKKSFIVKRKNATITYSVREVDIPKKPLRVAITVLHARADNLPAKYWFLYMWTNVSDGFEGKEPHGLAQRYPSEKGVHEIGENSVWAMGDKKQIFSEIITGPVIYYEVGVWGKDKAFSNDDQLEIVSDTLYMADYKPGDVIQTSEDGDDGVSASGTIKREIRFSAAD